MLWKQQQVKVCVPSTLNYRLCCDDVISTHPAKTFTGSRRVRHVEISDRPYENVHHIATIVFSSLVNPGDKRPQLAHNTMAYLCIVGSLLCVIVNVQGHGLLLDPPGRSSLWREGYDVEINYQDNELFCGGFQNQWEEHDGKCGLCGDPWQGPRENEAGGKYATDIIPRSYKPGSVIDVKVDLTANHLGWFEFSLCANNNWMKNFTEDCLQLLELADDGRSGTRYTISDRTGIYDIKLKLPDQLTCSQCVIQWKYHTANSWGVDADGTGCMGCGAQEEFYSCADIAISENGGTTSGPATTSESTQTTVTDNWTTTVSEATTQNPDVTSILPENCRATGPWEGQIDVTDWCIRNCALGNCPTDVCLCD